MSTDYQEYNLNLGYKNVQDKKFVPLCKGVVQSLTDNANFPEVKPLVDDLRTLLDTYTDSIPSKAEKSSKLDAIKDANCTLVKFQLRKVGFHVLMAADNDFAKLKGTGFEMQKLKGGKTPIEFPMPVIKSLHTNGVPRQLIVKVAATKKARLYDVQISTDKVNWSFFANTASTVLANGLTPEVTLYVQARYRNGKHETPWSTMMETRIFDDTVAVSVAN